MSPADRSPRCRRPVPALAAAVALALAAMAGVDRASGASIAAAEAADAPHRCACGMNCRGSCCCAPRETRRPSTPTPAPASRRADPRACVDAAPCGDPVVPGAPTGSAQGKGAALPVAVGLPIGSPGSYRPDASRHVLPTRRVSRLEKPPRRPVLG